MKMGGMRVIAGLVLLSAAVTCGLETSCDVMKNEKSLPCYGVLGHTVLLYLEYNSAAYDLEIKNTTNITIYKTSKGIVRVQRADMKNNALVLNKTKPTDFGIYSLFLHYTNGTHFQTKTFELVAEEPVSPPVLSQVCLSYGELRVSCSAQGDNTQYTWSVGGRPLDGNTPHYSDGNGVIILGKDQSGSLTCTVFNHVSSRNVTEELLKCTGNDSGSPVKSCPHNITVKGIQSDVCNHTTSAQACPAGLDLITIVSVALGAVFLFFLMTLALYCVCQKRKAAESNASDHELVYAQVTTHKTVTNRKSRKKEPEVLYGEVKV